MSPRLSGVHSLVLSLWVGAALGPTLLVPNSVFATQAHEAPEGLYAHQMAHGFFIISMGILIYWLRYRELVHEKGWRLIQYSALFFILYNADSIAVHYLDGRHDLFETIDRSGWLGEIQIRMNSNGLAFVYYFLKMDHLLLLPAVIFLYGGLRELLKSASAGSSDGDRR